MRYLVHDLNTHYGVWDTSANVYVANRTYASEADVLADTLNDPTDNHPLRDDHPERMLPYAYTAKVTIPETGKVIDICGSVNAYEHSDAYVYASAEVCAVLGNNKISPSIVTYRIPDTKGD